jgi:hypothetical protein
VIMPLRAPERNFLTMEVGSRGHGVVARDIHFAMKQKASLAELLALVADDPKATEKIMDAWRDIEHWLGFLADQGIDVDVAYDENAGRFAVHVTRQGRH